MIQSYKHIECGTVTLISVGADKTRARWHKFYDGLYCGGCDGHFSVREFILVETDNVDLTNMKKNDRVKLC